ncbi:MAG: triose-phosphate isomerase [Bacteroidetes bacterium]|jgi:triosephosphate isomerase|nr:triose-phosphate isomerase [Bacteroidota bacterium]
MKRKKIVAGNWKMNGTYDDACKLTSEIVAMAKDELNGNTVVILAPPFPFIPTVNKLTEQTNIKISAQNCSSENSGAFTGEVSAAMIASCGAAYVIIGHSERRTIFKEQDDLLLKKVQMALANNLSVIFCIGETKEQREQAIHFKVAEEQLNNSIFKLSADEFSKCIIAYEPVWAIGTGLTATPAQAQEMHHYIRGCIAKSFTPQVAEQCSLLYGGSCNESNAAELFALEDIDGGLIGGASLKSRSFVNIIKSMKD